MKKNFIIGKKQIILAALVVVLGAAVYLNWSLGKTDINNIATGVDGTEQQTENVNATPEEEKGTDASAEKTEQETANQDTTSQKLLGDAKLVDAKTLANGDYFNVARLSRTKSRDEAINVIKTILNDEKLSDDDKKEANTKAMSLTDIIETESRIENLIKAKGFEDCMVYIADGKANAVVKTAGLTPEQATQIKNIIVTETKIKGETVTITEIK